MVLLTDVYRNLTSLWIKPRERAFKQFKSRVLNVLTGCSIPGLQTTQGAFAFLILNRVRSVRWKQLWILFYLWRNNGVTKPGVLYVRFDWYILN